MEKKAQFKQVFLFTIINYAGIFIGIFSTLFIYPKNKEFLGIIRYVESISQILFPIMVLGASHALINFYPALTEDNKKRLFNYSVFSVGLWSVLVLIVLLVVSPLFKWDDLQYFYFAFPIAVALAFVELFKRQAINLQKLAMPTLFEKIIPKIALPVIFVLLLCKFLSVEASIGYYIGAYILIFALVAYYLFRHYPFRFNFKFKPLYTELSRKEYFRYSLYSFAGSFGSFFAFRIDSIMIPEFLSFDANGTFNIGVTLASALAIPATGIFTLYAPIVSNYLKTGNLKELNMKYVEVAKMLFCIGGLLYSAIFVGIHFLFELLPTYDSLAPSIPIILILGFNVLINMATGFNSEIISYSKHYRFNIISIFVLIVLNVSLNLYFLMYTDLGLIGVACSSLISMTIFNIAKLLFIYKTFRLFPFDSGFVKLALLFLFSGTLVYFLPETESKMLTLVYKVSLNLAINIAVIYKFKLVYQITQWMDKALVKLGVSNDK
nr:oligosaccharide flippase family protein [uncultured Flavobacterium sp.]